MKTPTLVLLLVLPASLLCFGDAPRPMGWQRTGPFKYVDHSGLDRTRLELTRYEGNRIRLASAPAAASQDIGDIAVIADNGSIILQPQPAVLFDVALPANIAFSANSTGFSVAFAAAFIDSGFGSPLPLGDDSTVEVPLAFSFPFLGANYSSVFVNSDGNVTFGQGDTEATPRDAARLINGPPRIAPLFLDLDVTQNGSIRADARADRIVITWTDVPEFGTTRLHTFQMTLHSNGNIVFAFVRSDSRIGVVGVAEGGGQGPIQAIDYTAALPITLEAGAIFEEFRTATPKDVDIISAAQEFYRTHDDKYDFLVFFTDFPVDLGAAFAYELNISNNTRGLGLPRFDFTSFLGSDGELESVLMMNNIGLYWPDERKLVDPPIDKFRFFGGASASGGLGPGQLSRRARIMGTLNGDFGAFGSYTLGLNSAMSVMGQESGHRWAAFVPFVHPTKGISIDSLDLLGRQLAHWSFFFNVPVPAVQFGGDPRASSMEGNAIVDLGGGAFLTQRNELIDGYTPLDQYLLGLRRDSEVGPFWYVDEPRNSAGQSLEGLREVDAVDDVFFLGRRVNLTVANIQAFPGVGPRVPAIGDENDDGQGNDVKTMAFVLIVEQGPPSSPAHASGIQQVDNFRRVWQQYVNGPATGGRGKFDTRLNPAVF